MMDINDEVQLNKPVIRVSVRNLVEFILRSGNIDNTRKSKGSDVQAMQEGARIHRMIQKRMGSSYHPEVGLKYTASFENYSIMIEGRADGIIEDNPVTVDEIKSTHVELFHLKEAEPVHLAQAKVYAFIVMASVLRQEDVDYEGSLENEDNSIEAVSTDQKEMLCAYCPEIMTDVISVRITYCNVESLETKYFHENYTFAELKSWFNEIINEYKKWAEFEINWKVIRDYSISKLQFPFPYRAGQKELVAQVYHTISDRNRLFIEAPTGTGKTVSTVYPAVRAMGEGKATKIFYLTAKTITRTAALDCFNHLRDMSLRIKTVIITAKEKACLLEKPDCNPETCKYAKGHFDRINAAIYDLLTNEDSFSRETINEYAIKHQVCPFEMSLDMSLFSDSIICDYNYVFDPNVYLRRFFSEGISGNYVFLVDEAHNLVDRAINMYSAEVTKEQMLEVKRLIKPYDKKLEKALESANKQMLALKKECEDVNVLEEITSLVISLIKVNGQLERFLDEDEKCPDRDKVLDFYFEIRHFLNMYENMSMEDYLIYDRINDENEFMVKLLCTNPARSLRTCLDKGISTVFFSATLLPIQYFKDMLADSMDNAVYAKSVFDPNNRGIFIANDVSSKYNRRNDTEYYNIASYINTVVRERKGNYLVFFPSYSFLQNVYSSFEDFFLDESIECIVQNGRMSEEERESFLKKFDKNSEADTNALMPANVISNEVLTSSADTLIGFCVMGGIFSEGIDLRGDNLIGTIIVGTGLPMVNPERNIMKDKYDEDDGVGFDYAYRYPGMNKVLQAAGRVIRTEEDKGVIVLLDERFLQNYNKRLFPREWSGYKEVSLRSVQREVASFWKKIDES